MRRKSVLKEDTTNDQEISIRCMVVTDPFGSTEGRLQGVHCASLCDRTVLKVVFKVFSCTHLDQAARLTG